MKFTKSNRSITELNYFLVLSTRHRTGVLDGEIARRLRELFVQYGENYNLRLNRWEYTESCIKIWFEADPNFEISKFINAFKSASSRNIKREFPGIVPRLPDRQLWSRAYCIFSLGEIDERVVDEYLERQQADRIDRRTREHRRGKTDSKRKGITDENV